MRRQRFAVIGLGKFGYHLARCLYGMGHDVLAVDRNPDTVAAAQSCCSRAAVADAADRAELEAAGVASADVAVVALGTRLEASVLATLFLRELGVRRVLAKATTPHHGRILKRVGATELVQPEREMAARVARSLADPDVLESLPFLEGYVLVELRAPAALVGATLAEADVRRRHRLSVALIKRGEKGSQVAVPARPDERIRDGDVLVVLARTEDVELFRGKRGGLRRGRGQVSA